MPDAEHWLPDWNHNVNKIKIVKRCLKVENIFKQVTLEKVEFILRCFELDARVNFFNDLLPAEFFGRMSAGTTMPFNTKLGCF